MIEVLAENSSQVVIAVDYCIYLINKKKEVIPLEYLLITTNFKEEFKYGILTNRYSKEELEKYAKRAKKYNKKYEQLLIEEGGLPENDFKQYIKKKYEQTLADFNKAVNKKIYPNVNLDPHWIDYYEGALREI